MVDPPITFGGDYMLNGTLEVSSTLDITFSGQGRYTWKGRVLAVASHVLYPATFGV